MDPSLVFPFIYLVVASSLIAKNDYISFVVVLAFSFFSLLGFCFLSSHGRPFLFLNLAVQAVRSTAVRIAALVTSGQEAFLRLFGINFKETSWQEFRQAYLATGRIKRLFVVQGAWVQAELRDGDDEGNKIWFTIDSPKTFKKELRREQLRLQIDPSQFVPVMFRNKTTDKLAAFILFVIIAAFMLPFLLSLAASDQHPAESVEIREQALNTKEREAIFRGLISEMDTRDQDKDLLAWELAALTKGLTEKSLEKICTDAVAIAASKSSDAVEFDHFGAAIDKILSELNPEIRELDDEAARLTAFHEAGHAVVAWTLGMPLLQVSIVPDRTSLGRNLICPPKIRLLRKDAQINKMACSLGGRASEVLFLNTISSGSGNDIERVIGTANKMVKKYGMVDLDLVVLISQKPKSGKTKLKVDKEVKRLVARAQKKATKILKDKKESVVKLVNRLLEEKSLYKDSLLNILGPKIAEAVTEEAAQAAENS